MPATIRACFDGRFAYVYVWLSKEHRIAYVGQTNNAAGTLGRAVQHVLPGGTFRFRFEEEVGLGIERAEDLILLSYPLPLGAEFTGAESSYREGIEYVVQRGLRDARMNLKPRFRLISKVTYTERAALREVQTYATKIIDRFTQTYTHLSPLDSITVVQETAG